MKEKIILEKEAMGRSIRRISHEIIEKNGGLEDVVLIGILTRGKSLAARIKENLEALEDMPIEMGVLDIRTHRDDKVLSEALDESEMNVTITGKKVIIIDDVLYTGRTIRAAIEKIFKAGRPSMIQLAVLIDRGHRELPIRADYVGKNVPTSRREKVRVQLIENDECDRVSIINI